MRSVNPIPIITIFCTLLLLSACGGGGGDSGAAAATPTATPTGVECVVGTSAIGECTI